MQNKKVYIEYKFIEGPYGGANQFLKNLKQYFLDTGCYTENPEMADFILINHTNISKEVLALKRRDPSKILIHRMDGPVSKHRKHSLIIDKHSFLLDKLVCNGTIFQSKWTEDNCLQLGYKKTGLITVIHNAPNKDVFYRKQIENEAQIENRVSKVKLVSTSWSANWNKGFDIMQYLDQNLDFSRYEYTFIGRSPIVFKNIIQIDPQKSDSLANTLRNQDIYLALSRSESCSNSLLEAINCGLPVVARNSGCYPEVVKDGGVIFQSLEDCIDQIDSVAKDIEQYKQKLPFYDISEIGKKYFDFMIQVSQSIEKKTISKKQFGFRKRGLWNLTCLFVKIYIKIANKLYN